MTAGISYSLNIPVGTYSLSFDLSGFKKAVRRSIALDVNQVITLNMTMQLGQNAGSRRRHCRGSPGRYQQYAARGGRQQSLSERTCLSTPATATSSCSCSRECNRSWDQAAERFMVAIARAPCPSMVAVIVPTISASTAATQTINSSICRRFSLHRIAIEEFRVITNTFDAEYGRNSGAVVNVVTKSGTNQWHGNVYEYFRNKVLNAQGYFKTVEAAVQPESVWRNVRWTN